jgi:hypothetical protein
LFAEGVLNPSNCQRSEAEKKLSLQLAAGNPQVESFRTDLTDMGFYHKRITWKLVV